MLPVPGNAGTAYNDLIIGRGNDLGSADPTYGKAWYDDLRFYYEYKHLAFIQSVMTL